jgi:hypothetical protein
VKIEYFLIKLIEKICIKKAVFLMVVVFDGLEARIKEEEPNRSFLQGLRDRSLNNRDISGTFNGVT